LVIAARLKLPGFTIPMAGNKRRRKKSFFMAYKVM